MPSSSRSRGIAFHGQDTPWKGQGQYHSHKPLMALPAHPVQSLLLCPPEHLPGRNVVTKHLSFSAYLDSASTQTQAITGYRTCLNSGPTEFASHGHIHPQIEHRQCTSHPSLNVGLVKTWLAETKVLNT